MALTWIIMNSFNLNFFRNYSLYNSLKDQFSHHKNSSEFSNLAKVSSKKNLSINL
jgi:hypothetical protein